MQHGHPLTLTLSPAAGEREKMSVPQRGSLNPKNGSSADRNVCLTINFGFRAERSEVAQRLQLLPSPHPMGRGSG